MSLWTILKVILQCSGSVCRIWSENTSVCIVLHVLIREIFYLGTEDKEELRLIRVFAIGVEIFIMLLL